MDPKNNTNPYYKTSHDLRFAVLTPEQESTLFSRMKEDPSAREFLIENHLLFAQTTAQKMAQGRLPGDEVISSANEALMECIDKFDATRGARFTTYLRFYIRRAISDLWRSIDPVDYKRRFPKPEELEDLKPSSIQDPEGASPFASAKNPDDVIFTPDYAGDDFKRVTLGLLEKFSSKLSSSERLLLNRVYHEEMSFADVGRLDGCSREAVRNQHNRVIEKLRRAFRSAKELE